MAFDRQSETDRCIKIEEPLILISIPIGIHEVHDVYEAVRFAWRVDVNRASEYGLVLAHDRDTVQGAFRPRKWLPAESVEFACCKNFLCVDLSGRYGFLGDIAESQVRRIYEGKKVPRGFLTRNPIRYCEPENT